jgi:prepilin-type N-terminal cleavage/methylation domain-containing protein
MNERPIAFRCAGFSLVEVAIVLLIVGLLLGGLLMPLSAQIDQQRNSDTKKAEDEIVQALIGYAVANGRLPCPATATLATGVANAGVANAPTASGCTGGPTGVLPWVTLGVNETDAWGRRYTYRVSATFSQILPATNFGCTPSTAPTQSAFALCSPGDNNVYLVPSPTATPLVQQIPAVIVSHGKNGLGAYTPAGTQMAGAAGDELTNANGGVNFRSYVPSNTFDDLVTWVSPNILMNRMVAAGKLP